METRFQQGALVEQGDVDSMVLLGSMHFRGQGGPQDFAEARRLFQMAADLGSAAARTTCIFAMVASGLRSALASMPSPSSSMATQLFNPSPSQSAPPSEGSRGSDPSAPTPVEPAMSTRSSAVITLAFF